MNLNITPDVIIVLLLVLNTIFFYAYWRYIRYSFNFYKAFDLVIISMIAFLVLARVAGLIEAGATAQISDIRMLVRIWDLRMDYLVMLFVPAIAFQFYVIHLDRISNWRDRLGAFLVAGKFYVIGILVIEILRAYMNKLPTKDIAYDVAIIISLVVVWLFVKLVLLKRMKSARASLLEVLFSFIVVSTCLLISHIYPDDGTYLRIGLLCLLSLITAISLLRLSASPVSESTSLNQNRI